MADDGAVYEGNGHAQDVDDRDHHFEQDGMVEGESFGPQPHPYLHDPLLYISGLPNWVTDENLAGALVTCAPFRPKINRENVGPDGLVGGTLEFKFQEKGASLSRLFSFTFSYLFTAISQLRRPWPR
jgi:polyadenylate-binding protein